MISDSFHHIVESPPSLGISSLDITKVTMIETTEVRITSCVSGCSKFIFSRVGVLRALDHVVDVYEMKLVTTIITRIAKIHTSSCTCTAAPARAASRMKVINATPVTP
jgi:hypothetical protein